MNKSSLSSLSPDPRYKAVARGIASLLDHPETARSTRCFEGRNLILAFIEWVWMHGANGSAPKDIDNIQLHGPELVNAFFGLDPEKLQAERIDREESRKRIAANFKQSEDRIQRNPGTVVIRNTEEEQ